MKLFLITFLLLTQFSFATECFQNNSQNVVNDLPSRNLSKPRAAGLVTGYAKFDKDKKVRYLNEQERLAYKLEIKPSGQPGAKLYYSKEAQERLVLRKLVEDIRSAKIDFETLDLRKIKREFALLDAEFEHLFKINYEHHATKLMLKIKGGDENAKKALEALKTNLEQAVYETQKEERRQLNQYIENILLMNENTPRLAPHFASARAEYARPVNSRDGSIYIVDIDGAIYLNDRPERHYFHHSSFNGGLPVSGAGEMEIVDGIPTIIDNSSGHYAPEVEHLDWSINHFANSGIDMSNTRREVWDRSMVNRLGTGETLDTPEIQLESLIDQNILDSLPF